VLVVAAAVAGACVAVGGLGYYLHVNGKITLALPSFKSFAALKARAGALFRRSGSALSTPLVDGADEV